MLGGMFMMLVSMKGMPVSHFMMMSRFVMISLFKMEQLGIGWLRQDSSV